MARGDIGSRADSRRFEDMPQRGGVGDQSNACRNGTVGCPGETVGDELPCSACFFGGE
jgi:hypothetical protein